jgi:hypothetical protein
VQHDTPAEVARLASGAIGQCHAWGPQEHRSTYERMLAAAMRYSAVVKLRRGRRDSSPSAPPSVVLELRLHSVFAADACYLCRGVLGYKGTPPPILIVQGDRHLF